MLWFNIDIYIYIQLLSFLPTNQASNKRKEYNNLAGMQKENPHCSRMSISGPTSTTTPAGKKPRLVFTDVQRRTLMAIFQTTRRPSKEIQTAIAEQLGLKISTVANFFMNARRRSFEKYIEDEHSEGSSAMPTTTTHEDDPYSDRAPSSALARVWTRRLSFLLLEVVRSTEIDGWLLLRLCLQFLMIRVRRKSLFSSDGSLLGLVRPSVSIQVDRDTLFHEPGSGDPPSIFVSWRFLVWVVIFLGRFFFKGKLTPPPSPSPLLLLIFVENPSFPLWKFCLHLFS